MKRLRMLLQIVFLFVLLPLENAFAYIDPGAGGILLQLLLSGIVGIGVAVRAYWKRLPRLRRKNHSDRHS
jgi:hypothetical protein